MSDLITELKQIGSICLNVTDESEPKAAHLAGQLKTFFAHVVAGAPENGKAIETLNTLNKLVAENPGIVEFLTDQKAMDKVKKLSTNPLIKQLL